MKESFRLLWHLQQLDTELRTLTEKLNQIPSRVEDLKKAAATVKSELDQAKVDIVEHKKQYKLGEVELKGTEEKAAGYSVQLYSAKTNEQYKAFLKEIEAQKKLKNGIEDRMILLMEETEALDRKVRENEKKSAELDIETARKIEMLDSEKKEIEAAIATRKEQRETTVAEIPAELLKRYERVRASKGGIAVATVRKERCSGCMSPIPAQRILEVERQDHLYLCEACGRILIVEQE
ncbi:MAG TPA: C4-type zinc ribbon domain-containing protein [bacterium]|nr:C4-type zinc ribbon domain-containing protein [bacterium]